MGCIARDNVELGHRNPRRSVRVDPQPGVRPTTMGCSFCARAQERRVLSGAVTRDVRCAALESACVQITLQACQRGLPPEPPHSQQGQTNGGTPGSTVVEDVSHTSWVRLDGVDLQEVFDRRLRVMQCCPHYLRGRFRQATRCALEARHQAVR